MEFYNNRHVRIRFACCAKFKVLVFLTAMSLRTHAAPIYSDLEKSEIRLGRDEMRVVYGIRTQMRDNDGVNGLTTLASSTNQAAATAIFGCDMMTWLDDREKCQATLKPSIGYEEKERLRKEALQANERLLAAQADLKNHAHAAYLHFKKAVAFAPEDPKARAYVAAAALEMDQYRTTLAYIQDAQALHYMDSRGYLAMLRGEALTRNPKASRDEIKSGISDLQRAVANSSNLPKYEIDFRTDALARARKSLSSFDNNLCASQWKSDLPNLTLFDPQIVPKSRELPFNLTLGTSLEFNDNVTNGRSRPQTVAVPAPMTDTAVPASSGNITPPPAMRKTIGKQLRSVDFNESSLFLNRSFDFPNSYHLERRRADEISPAEECGSSKSDWLPPELSLTDTLRFDYRFTADSYDRLTNLDTISQLGSVAYQHLFSPWFAVVTNLTDVLLYRNLAISSNLASAQIGFSFTPNSRTSSKLSFIESRVDGFAPATRITDPDGFTHRAELAQTFVLSHDPVDFQRALSLNLTYAHQWNEVQGLNGRSDFNDFFAGLQYDLRIHRGNSFLRSISASLTENYRPRQAHHALAVSFDSPDFFPQYDIQNQIVAEITAYWWYDQRIANSGFNDASRFETTFRYQRTDVDSNLSTGNYAQNLFLATFKVNF